MHGGSSTLRCVSLGTLLKALFALLVGVLFITFSNDVAANIQLPAAAAVYANVQTVAYPPFLSATRGEDAHSIFRVTKPPAISPLHASQLLQASMAVSLSSGEEGSLVSPFALDYDSIIPSPQQNGSGAAQQSWLHDEGTHARLIILETDMVAVNSDWNFAAAATALDDDGAVSAPLFRIPDIAALTNTLLSLEHSGTLRRNRKGDLIVFVVACSERTQCHKALDRRGSMHHHLIPLASSLHATREQQELFSAFSAFVFPFASTEIAQRTQQALYHAAATLLSLEKLPNACGERDDTLVAVIDLNDVAVCSDVFEYYRVDAALIHLIGFRNATESQSALGCCWFAQAAAHALGEERIPVELIGQPVVSHRFVGGSTMSIMRLFLRSVRTQSFLRQRHGDSIAPLLTLVAVKEFRSHVHVLNDVLLKRNALHRRAVVTDANASVCEGVARREEAVASMCLASTDGRPRWQMVVETKGCTQFPRFEEAPPAPRAAASSLPPQRIAPALPSCNSVVPGDAVLVDTQRNHTVNSFLASLIRQRALHDLLVSASGHYGLKGTDTSKLSSRGRDMENLESRSSLEQCTGRNGWQDAVIAYAAGYSERRTIAPLLNTFTQYHREHCTKLFLFVFQEHMSLYANEHPDIIPVAVDAYRGGRLLTIKCKLNKQRKEVIYKWLSEKLFEQFIGVKLNNPDARPFRYILVIDSRDVFFQDDPFQQFEVLDHELQRGSPDAPVSHDKQQQNPSTFMVFPPETSYFGELEWAFRGGFEFNAKWVEMAFGASYLQHMLRSTLPIRHCLSLREKCDQKINASSTFCASPCNIAHGSDPVPPPPLPIVCGGIYGGTSVAVLDFLKLLVNAMSARPPKQDCNNDQGVMNGLIGGGFAIAGFPHDVLVTNPSSTAFTHRPRRGTVSWSADGRHLMNCRGERYAVVHQLDRFDGVWQRLHTHLSKNITV